MGAPTTTTVANNNNSNDIDNNLSRNINATNNNNHNNNHHRSVSPSGTTKHHTMAATTTTNMAGGGGATTNSNNSTSFVGNFGSGGGASTTRSQATTTVMGGGGGALKKFFRRNNSTRSSPPQLHPDSTTVTAAMAAAAAAGAGTASEDTTTQQQQPSRGNKKGKRGLLGSFLNHNHGNSTNAPSSTPVKNRNHEAKNEQPDSLRSKSPSNPQSPTTIPTTPPPANRRAPSESAKAAGEVTARPEQHQDHNDNAASPSSEILIGKEEPVVVDGDEVGGGGQHQFRQQQQHRKQSTKERDGFCRRVNSYDGQVIHVEEKPAYELGNYLGGGVAGVVYEGHRLQPMEEYPVRLGYRDTPHVITTAAAAGASSTDDAGSGSNNSNKGRPFPNSFLCVPGHANDAVQDSTVMSRMGNRDTSLLTLDSAAGGGGGGQSKRQLLRPDGTTTTSQRMTEHTEEVALEATEVARATDKPVVIIDKVDAPSRSKHFAEAAAASILQKGGGSNTNSNSIDGGGGNVKGGAPATFSDDPNAADPTSDMSFLTTGLMEETVAVKILNPVGFRTLSVDVTQTAVVAREGDPLDKEVVQGVRPMEERHVWWLINPSSRNLRTLQRYGPDNGGGSKGTPRSVEVDRGSPEKGLRISVIAAYRDPKTAQLKELPLTRCIEIWGHVPFGASDSEFKAIMDAIDKVNQGFPPPPVPPFLLVDHVTGRIGTEGTISTTHSETYGMEDLKISPMSSKRTGLYRAAYSERSTVFCEELCAYIAIPAAPSKYLKWLRQRRAATKEIRNMMLIGRHPNVVHLFEVLELIQDTKSTMFLILELVRGGELFDLISSNAAKITNNDKIPDGFTESEVVMRKFFRELASGVHYCHDNGIAHRDLKPENLLVHNGRDGVCQLKIADFGLSAAFGPHSKANTDQDTAVESFCSGSLGAITPGRSATAAPATSGGAQAVPAPGGGGAVGDTVVVYDSDASPSTSPAVSPIKQQVEKLLSAGNNALAFLTCGAVEDIINCGPKPSEVDSTPTPLQRMTSVVGSPHYVAPEIISQSDTKQQQRQQGSSGDVGGKDGDSEPLRRGYDGTKADVWSAGVILYAMLYRSLPFGEDLLRCPRYQSFKKWYDEVKKKSMRRSNIMVPLSQPITELDMQNFLGPHWFFPSKSSPESRDLIIYMLNPDPDQRPSIQLVLQHPWLLKEAR